ncbi:uncharacterized protein [Coffea arabica]|uniref:Uncharacterized protein n=1 Tax=Coffea arabica TaxID=13443 RepID=A0A6P6WK54_COFAR|nr:proteasome assembly chaperone 4-like [Coffea arabica]
MGGLDEDEDCYHRRHEASSVGSCSIAIPPLQTLDDGSRSSGVEIISFSDVVDDASLHFHIIRLHQQIYAWIGCNSAKFGHLYAAAPTRPSNAVSVTSLIGGSSDNAGAGIARRIVLKTGLNVVLACNLPKNSPLLEAAAERRLVQKLVSLGYATPKSGVSSSTQEG